jgi:uncharacterized delta-60 repeat protein
MNSNRTETTFEQLESRQLFSAGALDPSFSLDGIATFPFLNGGKESATNVAVQNDGKTIVVGQTEIILGNKFFRKFAIARFNFDGTPDKNFGQFKTGKVSIDVGDMNDAAANGVAIQPDGKIVVVGSARMDRPIGLDGPSFAVVRLTADGLLDKTFDGDGKQVFDFGDDVSTASDVTLQGDGKILVVGTNLSGGLISQDHNFAVARLNPNGSLDGSFDFDGRRQIGFGSDDFAQSVAIDPTGKKIIVAGFSGNSSSSSRIAVASLNLRDGSRDASFGTLGSGIVLTKLPSRPSAMARSVMVEPGGKIVVAGAGGDASAGALNFLLARYLPNGQLDTTFGPAHTGFADVGFGAKDEAFGVIPSASGGLVVAGASDGKFAIAGLTSDGVLDTSFGKLGKVVTDAAVDSFSAVGLAQGPGRRFVVAGGNQFRTARYFDQGANVLALGSFDPNASESGPDPATIIVTRSERLPVPTRILLSIGGSAAKPDAAGADYTLAGMAPLTLTLPLTRGRAADFGGTIVLPTTPFVEIPAGQTFAVVTLTPIDDATRESTETATFAIVPGPGESLGTNSRTTVSILDNDNFSTPLILGTAIAKQSGPMGLFSERLIDQLV